MKTQLVKTNFKDCTWGFGFVKKLNTVIVKILNLYIILLLTCITLLSGIFPLPAMHSLLVTSDVRNI